MLPRSQRLSVEQFNKVMEKGRVTHSPLFLVRILSVTTDYLRIATVAPKKVAKTAVARNRIRRKLYEAARTLRPNMKPSLHVIVFAKPAILDVSQKDITVDMKSLFVKVGIMR